jgi:predicted aldo/keto reductase-like oxidoreductase
MKRRRFIARTAAATTLLAAFPADLSAVERQASVPRRIERRSLGKTGLKFSMLGFGGFMLNKTSPDTARNLVSEAIAAGVNYFDVAPTYGNAEELLGPALEPHRKRVFLACKTTQRSSAEAAAELERSLERLRTDHFDLYQLHAVTTLKDVDAIFSNDGAIHAFEAARKAGKIRLIGFSAHSVEAANALMDRYAFDTILFPVNYGTWHAGNFGPQVLAKAQEKGLGILALKAMAKRPWPPEANRSEYPNCWYEPMTEPAEALMGLRFTLSHPVTAAVSPADAKSFRLALQLVPQFQPLRPEEVVEMKKKALAEKPLFRFPLEERAEHHPCYCQTVVV